MNDILPLLPVLIPLAIIQYGLAIFGLYDLFQEDRRVKGDNKVIWALAVFFLSMVGPVLYFLVGREETRGADTGGVARTDPRAIEGILARWPRVGTDGAAISTHGLSKRYGGVRALDDLNLEVPTGSIFGFLGPNGAGKTTTLRLLTGLAHPTSGTGSVAGVPIGGTGGQVARHIGYLDQDPRFYGWMKGRELLEMVARLYGLEGQEMRARVWEVLEIVGLTDAYDRRVGGYSGGMRQRLGIGQALLNRPQVLFLDEPVSALDPEGRRDILQIIERLRGTATVFMSTHILSDVERVCDRVAILNYGRLVIEAPIDELLERYAQPIYEIEPEPNQPGAIDRVADAIRGQRFVREVRPDVDRLRVFVSEPKVAATELLPLVSASGVAVERFERARPSLEDVFLLLVAGAASGGVATPPPAGLAIPATGLDGRGRR
jgi:ABC-2 type transport system ATP-binding protein